MPSLYPRYTPNTPSDPSLINTPGNVSAFKLDTSAPGPSDPGYTDLEHQKSAWELNNPGKPFPGGTGGTPSDLQTATDAYYAGLNKTAPDEAAIREATRARMQNQIDAIDSEYASIFAQNTADAQVRQGQTRATQARGGLIGSDIGTAQTDQTTRLNARIQAASEAEKSNRIAAVYTKIDSSAQEEIAAKKAEALGNAKAYIDYLQKAQDTAKESIKSLAGGGVSLDQLSTDQYQKLLKASGLDDFTLKAFYNSNKPEQTQTKYNYEVKNGKILAYGVNPTTNKLEMLSTDVPPGTTTADGNYKTQFAPNGQLLLIPENFDTTKSLDSQIIKAGNYKAPTAGNATTGALKEVAPSLNNLKDPSTGYVDPQAYKEMYATFIQNNPGMGDEFLKEYSPKIYIDPANQYQFQ